MIPQTVPVRRARAAPPPPFLAAKVRLAAGLVGYATALPAAEIIARPRGSAPVAAARHIVMYLLNAAFAASHAHIAQALQRDRSTVAHALRMVEERREDPAFDAMMDDLEDLLRNAPPPAADACAS